MSLPKVQTLLAEANNVINDEIWKSRMTSHALGTDRDLTALCVYRNYMKHLKRLAGNRKEGEDEDDKEGGDDDDDGDENRTTVTTSRAGQSTTERRCLHDCREEGCLTPGIKRVTVRIPWGKDHDVIVPPNSPGSVRGHRNEEMTTASVIPSDTSCRFARLQMRTFRRKWS